MLDWTDRHCRFFHRLLSQKALLYSEMVTTGAILHGDRDRLLGFNPVEKPLVLQIGDPTLWTWPLQRESDRTMAMTKSISTSDARVIGFKRGALGRA